MKIKKDSPQETVKLQNTVIKMQSNVINELLLLLMQHMDTDDTEELPCILKINMIAKIRAGIGADYYLKKGEN